MQEPPWEEKVRQRAHAIYLQRGRTPGLDMDDWLQAEKELACARESAIDESLEESFPASDSPAL